LWYAKQHDTVLVVANEGLYYNTQQHTYSGRAIAFIQEHTEVLVH